jgi:hypothetical protein
MKKLVLVLAMILLAFGLAGCGDKPVEVNPETFSETEFMEEIKPHIEVLNSCVTEEFCAEVDDTVSYMALFKNEEDAYSEISKPDKLVEIPRDLSIEEMEAEYPDYYLDPAMIEYLKVTNFNTVDEIKSHVATYLGEAVTGYILEGNYDVWLDLNFSETEDGLYLMRGGRGYGALHYDTESAKYAEMIDGKCYVIVDVYYFEELDHTEKLEFTPTSDGWLMTNIE